MTRTILLANQKGGTAKTTSAIALSHDLAQRGHTVVLIDLDAQGNLSSALGVKPSPSLYQVLLGLTKLSDALIEVHPDLWLLGGDKSTKELKEILVGKPYRETILSRTLAPVESDFIILDTGPSRDLMHDNAHHAADQVIVPCALDFLAMAGLAQEVESLKEVREHGHKIELLAVLPVFFEQVTNESRRNLQALTTKFGSLVLPAVPRTVLLREAPSYGKTIWEYLPATHKACAAYKRLTERVLNGQ